MSDWTRTIVGGAIAGTLAIWIAAAPPTWLYEYFSNLIISMTTRDLEGTRENVPKPEETSDQYSIEREDKYVIPMGLSSKSFSNCIKTGGRRKLIEEQDYKIKKVSAAIRFIIPLSNEDIISESYDFCRRKMRK